jgi:hypothetical protein
MPGLTQSQAIAYVQQGTSWRSDHAAEITTQFSLSQREELEMGLSLPWWLIRRDVPVQGTPLNPIVPLTGIDLIRMIDDGGVYWLYPDPGTGQPPGRRYLRKRPLDWMQNFLGEGSTQIVQSPFDAVSNVVLPVGDAFYYALLEGSLYVLPMPSVPFTLYVNAYVHDSDFSTLGANDQNLWLQNASSVIANLVGMHLAEDFQDDAAYQKFQRRYQSGQLRLLNEIIQREVSDNELKMGNQPDWWN